MVFHQGDPGETMYLVVSGQVEVLAGADQAALAALGPGSFVGELALLLGEPRSATLRVVADTWLWALRRADLDALLAEHPVIGVELSRELGRRLVATNRQLVAPPTTRFTAVFGQGAASLAAAVAARAAPAGSGSSSPRAAEAGPLPEGVTRLALEPPDAETLAAMAGRDVEGLAHLLIVVPPSETAPRPGGGHAGRAHRRLRSRAGLDRPFRARPTPCCAATAAPGRSPGWPAG